MKIIVNADDFGHSGRRTLSICDGFARGLLTTTTIMTNMSWFERAVSLAREQGFLKRVGLHFNLTEGVPLTKRMRECEFFCSDGEFNGNFHRSLKTRLVINKSLRQVVAEEASAQIERYCDAGFSLLHFDSHHHIHTDFSIATTLFPIARRYGFRTCRMSRTIGDNMTLVKRAYKDAFNAYARRAIGLLADEFTDFVDFRRHCQGLKGCCRIEIMVHPGLEEDVSLDEMADFWSSNSKVNFAVAQDI